MRIDVGMRRMIVLVIARVGNVTAAAAPTFTRAAVLVRVERREALEHEERHEADQGPEHHVHRIRTAAVRAQSVRKQMKEDDAEDHPAHGAQHQLQRSVRQATSPDPRPKQARCNDERGLDGENGGRSCSKRWHGSFRWSPETTRAPQSDARIKWTG